MDQDTHYANICLHLSAYVISNTSCTHVRWSNHSQADSIAKKTGWSSQTSTIHRLKGDSNYLELKLNADSFWAFQLCGVLRSAFAEGSCQVLGVSCRWCAWLMRWMGLMVRGLGRNWDLWDRRVCSFFMKLECRASAPFVLYTISQSP